MSVWVCYIGSKVVIKNFEIISRNNISFKMSVIDLKKIYIELTHESHESNNT